MSFGAGCFLMWLESVPGTDADGPSSEEQESAC